MADKAELEQKLLQALLAATSTEEVELIEAKLNVLGRYES